MHMYILKQYDIMRGMIIHVLNAGSSNKCFAETWNALSRRMEDFNSWLHFFHLAYIPPLRHLPFWKFK